MIPRKERVHVHNVRVKILKDTHGQDKIQATILLIDPQGNSAGEMDWAVWVNGGRDALINGEW